MRCNVDRNRRATIKTLQKLGKDERLYKISQSRKTSENASFYVTLFSVIFNNSCRYHYEVRGLEFRGILVFYYCYVDNGGLWR